MITKFIFLKEFLQSCNASNKFSPQKFGSWRPEEKGDDEIKKFAKQQEQCYHEQKLLDDWAWQNACDRSCFRYTPIERSSYSAPDTGDDKLPPLLIHWFKNLRLLGHRLLLQEYQSMDANVDLQSLLDSNSQMRRANRIIVPRIRFLV